VLNFSLNLKFRATGRARVRGEKQTVEGEDLIWSPVVST